LSIGYLGEFSMEACLFLRRCVGIPCGDHLDGGCVGSIGGDVDVEAFGILSGNEVGDEVGIFTCPISGWIGGAHVVLVRGMGIARWTRMGHG
jgi:hypothetical protein